MKRDKYMGMVVHQATTVVAVIDAEGKIVLETSRNRTSTSTPQLSLGKYRATTAGTPGDRALNSFECLGVEPINKGSL
jgi:hypothetical protein